MGLGPENWNLEWGLSNSKKRTGVSPTESLGRAESMLEIACCSPKICFSSLHPPPPLLLPSFFLLVRPPPLLLLHHDHHHHRHPHLRHHTARSLSHSSASPTLRSGYVTKSKPKECEQKCALPYLRLYTDYDRSLAHPQQMVEPHSRKR